ncbi:MAG TPA: heparinase II/III family protein, partial [Rhizomicrobium sp.]|nr:heparinase II/III family protein [Rhizomicrobium sp.]
MLLPLLPELIPAGVRRLATPLRVWWRGSWAYRRFLKGQLADHIVFHPWDALPRRLEEADSLLRGRFRFYGQTVDVPDGVSVFDLPAPNAAWNEALHSFNWLPALSTAGGEPSRKLATNLIGQWVKRNTRYSEPVWSPHIMARRMSHIFSHGRLVVVNSEMMWRSKLFVSLREQSRMLERISAEAPDGLPRLEAAAVLALSGLCLDDSPKRLEEGLKRLDTEIERQILPDGGHVSRSPEALLSAYRHIIMVMEALSAIGQEPPHALRNAHDRMAPMLRFFRHADGALACFNGGAESDTRMIAGLLARDDIRGQPFHHARHSGYQRLAAARTLLLLDCGQTPPGNFATSAHAGAGAFELSSGSDRIVVN